MKVVLFNGSPKPFGCTFTALSEVAKALNESGVETEIFQLGKDPIRGCIGCGACAKLDGQCVFNDEVVNKALKAAAGADGFVFGSPVYYASANGAMLALMDRMFYAGGKYFQGKPGTCVASARRAGTTSTLDQMNKYLQFANMPVVSSNYWNMVHGNTPDEVKQDLEGLQIMRNLGRNMAWLLKCIEAGKAAGIEPPIRESKIKTNFIR